MLTLSDVLAARETIKDAVRVTPVFSSMQLGGRINGGVTLWLKAESLQKTGSFKPRGALNRVRNTPHADLERGIITVSAGNHAQGVAWAAREAGVPCTVCMRANASHSKVAATRGYGAAVDQEAPDPTQAFDRLDVLLAETGRTLVHPFNDPAVIAGQGTVGLEILEEREAPEVVIVPVGGGGLISGIATAVKARYREARVIGVEPETSTALHSGLAAGHSVPVAPLSAADALNAPFAGENSLEICRALGVESVLVSEEDLFEAFRWLYARTKFAAELGAAASTAALLSGAVQIEPGQTVVAVVSGGNIAAKQAAAILDS
jgi:threonine dehydratase